MVNNQYIPIQFNTKIRLVSFLKFITTLSLLFVGLGFSYHSKAAYIQSLNANYIAFEAEGYNNIIRHRGDNDGFNTVEVNSFTSDFGSSVLPEDSNFSASANGALLADMRYELDMKSSTVEYQLVFNTVGTYRLYYRRSLFEKSGSDSYGGEDSFFYAAEFDGDPESEHGSRQSQNTEQDLHPINNPSEGEFFWANTKHDFIVSDEDIGKTLTFKISDREKGFAIDRFVFSHDNQLDVQEVGLDGDNNDLDLLVNSGTTSSGEPDIVFQIDHVPYSENDEEIQTRENNLAANYTNYLRKVQIQDAAGNASQIINELFDKINAQDGAKSALRTLITLTTNADYYPHWHDEVTLGLQREGEVARLVAVAAIDANEGQINDLAQVTPIRRYMDYGWALYMLGEFHRDSAQAIAFRATFENFIETYIEGTPPYYDNAYYTTGYNKEVFALDVASTISLLYRDIPKYIVIKEAFNTFWYNVTQMSYDADNSPHYDAGTGFHIILNMALRHGRENDVANSPHLLRVMDRMARTVMSSGQSAKWGKSMETTSNNYLLISAGASLPWTLKMGYRIWQNPFYLYIARKYDAFYQQDHGPIKANIYEADLWPLGIDAFDISLAKPSSDDITSRATPRITSTTAYDGLLLGRGDTNYTDVQDKLIISTGHHPRAPYLLMDLSYTQHKAAHDHRSGIEVHNYNGAHTISRIQRWSEANKTNGIYINPTDYIYPQAPYPSKQVSAPGKPEKFLEVMKYDPSFGYTIENYGAGMITKEAAFGFVDYSRYQYSGISTQRQVVLLHNGIIAVSDTIEAQTTYPGGHNGGSLYQVLPAHKTASGPNWVLLEQQPIMLPSALPVGELTTSNTLIYFAAAPNDTIIQLADNPYDPEDREWFSAHRTLTGGETFSIISLIIPLPSTNRVEELIEGINVNMHNATDSTITIPYTRQQALQITFTKDLQPSFEYVESQHLDK
jgi:hypothetical protein